MTYRIVGYEVTDHLLDLVGNDSFVATEPSGVTRRAGSAKSKSRAASMLGGCSDSENDRIAPTLCMGCLGSYSGSECPTCAEQERKLVKHIQRIEALFIDAKPHKWSEMLDAARGRGKPLDEREAGLLDITLDDDDRFTQHMSGKWMFTPTEEQPAGEADLDDGVEHG